MDSLSRTASGDGSRSSPNSTDSRRQTQHLADPDILAVQSLMKLSANTATLVHEPLDNALSSLQLRSRGDRDMACLQRLVGLMAPEYPTC